MASQLITRGLRVIVASLFLPMASISAQETQRLSVDSIGAESNGDSFGYPMGLSTDGRFVVFGSAASNLVSGDANARIDLFRKDAVTGAIDLASVDSAGVQGNDDSSWYAFAISADGTVVAFSSLATNLVPNDTNYAEDVFVHDFVTGLTERVSVDSSGKQGTNHGGTLFSVYPATSSDGRFIAFTSSADNLVPNDKNFTNDVFVHDRTTGITERASVDSSGVEGNAGSSVPAISADGRYVAFFSIATNLVGGDNNGVMDVFVHDRTTGTTERVSVDSSGVEGNDVSFSQVLSADGLIVAFTSAASNLVAGDTNGTYDVFVRDRSTGSTERVSIDSSGAEANNQSLDVSISSDGQRVAYVSDASNLVADDTNGTPDVFFRDRSVGVTERVSLDSCGAQGDDMSILGSISGDGRFVAFSSGATNLVAGDANGLFDVFLHEICGTPASWSNYGAGLPGTNGVPSLISLQNPAIGTTVTVDVANSYAQPTLGLLLLGFQRANVPTNRGGTLLVVPSMVVLLSFSYGGNSFTGAIPFDDGLCGVTLDLQAIESDPGAAKGVSFTQGLELILGR